MQPNLFSLEPTRKTYSVSELNARIRGLLDQHLGEIWVSGEISGVRLAASGHYYFTLKDGDSQVRCACFRMSARYLRFKPADGVAVIARGRLDVYDARGEYQLLVEHLEPQGYGALQFAFEQLKKKLSAEGLFDSARKRPLPKYPQRIGLVTSPSGAVIQDILNILPRRFPGLHVRFYPAMVQGEGSVDQVCRALRYFSDSQWPDVVILARGGGSLEDLWTFNDEQVARAIFDCSVPVVSAVGHETDFTIADFVADLRAPTPSAAAELVVCTREQVLESIAGCRRALEQQLRYRLSISARRLHERGVDRASAIVHRAIGRAFQRVDELQRCSADAVRRHLRSRRQRWQDLESHLRRMDLRLRLSESRRRHQTATARMAAAMDYYLHGKPATRLESLKAQLHQLSPLNVLQRGYAIVQDPAGHVIKSSLEAPSGSDLQIRLAEGRLNAQVK
ncbi:MAG TPA: exodeoxyribonuclease VII large subunit [Bryobacteraceae bacterium]|nr:exodeoxyribonuclease VII large subunit [Bryobacteraceae bacterium]